MVKDKNIASSSRPKKSKLLEDVRNSSNLRRPSCRPTHQFDFSNTVDDPIEVEEEEDPSGSSEQGSTFREESLSEDDFWDISSAPDVIETTEDSLDERATAIGEGQYEHTSQPTPSPICSSPLPFSCIFHFFHALYFPYFQPSPRSVFQIEEEIDLSLDLSSLTSPLLPPILNASS